jgi:phage baseplate assembly protein W
MALYRGFSTRAWVEGKKSFRIEDIECVKEDLFNHIYTRPGERPHMPGFGTRVPDLAFEPNDEQTIAILRADITEVVQYDPRVELVDIRIFSVPNDYGIVCVVELRYIEFNVVDELHIELGAGGKFSRIK